MSANNHQLNPVASNNLSTEPVSDIIEAYKLLSFKSSSIATAKLIDEANLKQKLRIINTWDSIKSNHISQDILEEYKKTIDIIRGLEYQIEEANKKLSLIYDRFYDIERPSEQEREDFNTDKNDILLHIHRLESRKAKEQSYYLKILNNIGFKETLSAPNVARLKNTEEGEGFLDSILKGANLNVVQNNYYNEADEKDDPVTIDVEPSEKEEDEENSIAAKWKNLS